jgi:putative endonuclease
MAARWWRCEGNVKHASLRLILRAAEGGVSKDEATVGAWLYILKCSDGSFYTGTTRADLEKRVAEHQGGEFDGYTAKRRPVALVFSEHFDRIIDAIAAERQIKGWSRAKKKALIAGDYQALQQAAKRSRSGRILRDADLRSAPQDEE